MKHWAKKGKMGVKSGLLGSKSGFLSVNNNGLAISLERLNGTKCSWFS